MVALKENKKNSGKTKVVGQRKNKKRDFQK